MDNRFINFGVRTISHSGFVPVVENLESYRHNLLRILVYHRIADPKATEGLLDPSLISATPMQFEQQMNFLRNNYHLLSVIELLEAIQAGRTLPAKSVMVTFDDGYHDFLDTAWPILERYQIPTLFFITTGYLSEGNQLFWWDKLYQAVIGTRREKFVIPTCGEYSLDGKDQRMKVFNELKKRIISQSDECARELLARILNESEVVLHNTGFLMNWSEAHFLKERGCYLAAHTRSHPILSRLSTAQALEEIRCSQQDILNRLGTVFPVVAYPSGHSIDCNNDLEPWLEKDGYKLAMSCIPGINVFPGCNIFKLKRIGLSYRVNLPEFRMILTGIYHFASYVQSRVFHLD